MVPASPSSQFFGEFNKQELMPSWFISIAIGSGTALTGWLFG